MPATDLTLLTNAARASGEIALKHWKKAPETWDKPDGAGPVTEADLAVNRMLHAELGAARPDYGWLSEESEDDPTRLIRARTFIIDPIDGTRAFLNGEPTFSHSLAIAEGDEVITAVVYLPAADLMFTATHDGLALLNGESIHATSAELDGATVLGSKRDFTDEKWAGGLPPVTRHFRPSLAYRLCLVAQGRFDAMLTLRPTWEWDVAAGGLIAERAGATVTDKSGAKAQFNRPSPRIDGMFAAGSALHQSLLSRAQIA